MKKDNSYTVDLIYNAGINQITRRIFVTTQTYQSIVEENIKEIARKNGLDESEITVRL